MEFKDSSPNPEKVGAAIFDGISATVANIHPTFDDEVEVKNKVLPITDVKQVREIWKDSGLDFAPTSVAISQTTSIVNYGSDGAILSGDSTIFVVLGDSQLELCYGITKNADGTIEFDKTIDAKNSRHQSEAVEDPVTEAEQYTDQEARDFVDDLARSLGTDGLKKALEDKWQAALDLLNFT